MIEIVLVFVLLAVAFSFFGIKMHKMIVVYRSKMGLKKILNLSHLCQEKAFFEQSDVFFIIEPFSKGIICRYGNNQSCLKKERIDGIFLIDSSKKRLFFSSTGGVFPCKVLSFQVGNETYEVDLSKR
ncbi:MAG: hypothetical protein WCP39_00055 [Chlamydiota bacterium]